MKRILITLITAAVTAALAVPAYAQAPSAPITTSKVNITQEQRHIIKEIIKTLPVTSAASNVHISVGDVATPDAHAQPIPAEVAAKVPQIKSHLFFVKDGKIAIVDPKDNKIAEVID